MNEAVLIEGIGEDEIKSEDEVKEDNGRSGNYLLTVSSEFVDLEKEGEYDGGGDDHMAEEA